MPIVVFTVALVLGISSPEYQEFRKHSNGNDAYSISFVDPCETVYEIQDMPCSSKICLVQTEPLAERGSLSVVNKTNCNQLARLT